MTRSYPSMIGHIWAVVGSLIALVFAQETSVMASPIESLETLRNSCLSYSMGWAPRDTNTKTRLNGLYRQSPFSPAGEVDLAATGFALAGLPAAVSHQLISSNEAARLALESSQRVLELVQKSAAASTSNQRKLYGYKGMLYHYYVWNNASNEFLCNGPGVEVSSIDTTLTMYGLLVCAQYFGGQTKANYEQAREGIDWAAWLDRTNLTHSNQFRTAYRVDTGFSGWWDWRTDEVTLICLMAAMSNTNLDLLAIWNAWRRDEQVYTPPGSTESYRCYASWFGDPFTVFYGLAFLDTQRLPLDVNGVDWFEQSKTAYQGHVAYFARERNYLDYMTLAYCGDSLSGNVIAKPQSSPNLPATSVDACPLYSLIGGLPFYGSTPASNQIVQTVNLLAATTTGFYQWTGWPASTVQPKSRPHTVISGNIIGQDIAFMGVAIENYLTNQIQDLVFRDERMQQVLNQLFPPEGQVPIQENSTLQYAWQGVPGDEYQLETTAQLSGSWETVNTVTCDEQGLILYSCEPSERQSFFRLTQPSRDR